MNRLAIFFAAGALTATAQVKTFEVASVKPSTPAGGGNMVRMMMGNRFGPGTADPTRWNCDNCPVSMLLMQAYNLKRFQITGPSWLDSERFDIAARVAEGATKEDLRLMQQSLLAERFGLKARLESKEMQVFDLVVGKNGTKMKASTAAPAGPAAPPPMLGAGGRDGQAMRIRMGADGLPELPKDRTMTMMVNGNARHQAVGEDMAQLVTFLSSQLDKPVTDSTGLAGRFDFLLTFAATNMRGPGAGGGGGDMVTIVRTGGGPGDSGNPIDGMEADLAVPLQKAIQDQLGLRLEPKKGMADVLTIDRIEKTPTEN